MSDIGDMESGSYAKLKYRESKKYMLPEIADGEQQSVLYFRETCDFCITPIDEDDDDPPLGGIFTDTNADKSEDLRDYAKSCLKLYNDAKQTDFKLVKVWKFNSASMSFHLTFIAREEDTDLLFRGSLSCFPFKAVFCEIKDDDVVTLLPGDDDYASFER